MSLPQAAPAVAPAPLPSLAQPSPAMEDAGFGRAYLVPRLLSLAAIDVQMFRITADHYLRIQFEAIRALMEFSRPDLPSPVRDVQKFRTTADLYRSKVLEHLCSSKESSRDQPLFSLHSRIERIADLRCKMGSGPRVSRKRKREARKIRSSTTRSNLQLVQELLLIDPSEQKFQRASQSVLCKREDSIIDLFVLLIHMTSPFEEEPVRSPTVDISGAIKTGRSSSDLHYTQSLIQDLYMTSKKAISAAHQNLGDKAQPNSSRGTKRLLEPDHEVSAPLLSPRMSSLPNHTDTRNEMPSEADGQGDLNPREHWIEEEEEESNRVTSKIRKVEGDDYGHGTDEGLWGRTPLGKQLEADLAAKAKAGHFRAFTMIMCDEPEQTEWDDHEDLAPSGTESSTHLQQTEWNEVDDDASSGTESSTDLQLTLPVPLIHMTSPFEEEPIRGPTVDISGAIKTGRSSSDLHYTQSLIQDLYMTSKKAISAAHQNLGDKAQPNSSRGTKRLLEPDHEVSAPLLSPRMSSLPNHTDTRNEMPSEADGQGDLNPREHLIEEEEESNRVTSKIRKVEGDDYGHGTDEGLWGRTPLGKQLEADLAAKAKAGHFRAFTMIMCDEPEQTEWDDHEDLAPSGTESSTHLQQTEWNEVDDDASSGTESSSICSMWTM